MSKILFFLIIGVVVYAIWRTSQRRSVAPPSAAAEQTMLRCARCGVHFPSGEALRDAAGRDYCCQAHLSESQSR